MRVIAIVQPDCMLQPIRYAVPLDIDSPSTYMNAVMVIIAYQVIGYIPLKVCAAQLVVVGRYSVCGRPSVQLVHAGIMYFVSNAIHPEATGEINAGG